MKKLLIILLFSILYSLFSIYPSPVKAATTREFQEAWSQFQESGVVSKEAFDAKTIEDVMHTTITAVGGQEIEVEGQPGTYRREGGALGMVSNLVGTLYATQPASSVEYLADVGNNLGLASPAYAQGLGWTAFTPVLGLWKAFRNIAYLFFVVIFVVIGFMIMFRTKIDPQTVISVQNALPRIIVTLLLITFSYAIAGFIVDLGQLSTRIVANLLKEEDLIVVYGDKAEKEEKLQALLNANIFELVNPLRNVDRLTEHLKEAGIPGVSTVTKIPVIGHLTVDVIIWLAAFFIMFKIFFALIGPYISIILSVVFAPFQILLGAFPGTTGGFGGWLRQIVANVLVFPVTFAMLAIAAVFKGYTEAVWVGKSADWGVRPGEYTIGWFPATIGNWGAVAGDLVAFGILFTVPKVVEIVQSLLQIKPTPWAGAAAEEIRGGVAKIPFIGDIIARRMPGGR